jgi:hypothetical protein
MITSKLLYHLNSNPDLWCRAEPIPAFYSLSLQKQFTSGMPVYTYNPSTQEAEAKESQV